MSIIRYHDGGASARGETESAHTADAAQTVHTQQSRDSNVPWEAREREKRGQKASLFYEWTSTGSSNVDALRACLLVAQAAVNIAIMS